MKTFSATYRDFVRFDVKPNEDAFSVSKKLPLFAVADGVTQSHYPNGRYALPYGAKEAARIFCRTVVQSLENQYAPENIKAAFDSANKKIKELNEKHGIQKRMDYKEHDWFDTVGVCAMVTKSNLYYGFVGDCGLAIFDKNNKKKFQTKDMVAPAIKRFNALYPDAHSWDPLKRQFIIRKDFRNNPDKKGYGSFTGQPEVQHYYVLGNKKLTKGDIVVLYSDGFYNYLKDKQFVKLLRKQRKGDLTKFVMHKAAQDPQKYGDDRTIVSFVV